MRRLFAGLAVLALAALVVPIHTAQAQFPSGSVVDNGGGSFTLTASAGGTPAVLDLGALMSTPVAVGALDALSATLSRGSAGCGGAFDFDPVDPTAFLGFSALAPCTDGPTGNLLAGGTARFDPNRDGGTVVDFAHLASRYGTDVITRPSFVLAPSSGTATVTISDTALHTADATVSPTVQVALCRTSDPAELRRGADYATGPSAPACPATDERLDPSGVVVTATSGDVAGYVGAATASGLAYPAPVVDAAVPTVFSEAIHGTHSPAVTDASSMTITVFVATAPPAITGTAVSAATGIGIAGEAFSLLPASCAGAPLASTIADSQGRFALLAPSSGGYCLSQDVVADGYQPLSARTTNAPATLGPLRLTARDSTITARFATTTGAAVASVCAALFETVTTDQSSGPVAGRRCADGAGTVDWNGIAVGVPVQIDVQTVPHNGLNFAAPPPAAAVPADLWSVGRTITDGTGSRATGRLRVLLQFCNVDSSAQNGTSIEVGTRAAALASCTPINDEFTIVEPGGARTVHLDTAPGTGIGAVRLPLSLDRFPRGQYQFHDTAAFGSAHRPVAFEIGAARATVITVTKNYHFPSAGGTIPSANPEPFRPAPPRLAPAGHPSPLPASPRHLLEPINDASIDAARESRPADGQPIRPNRSSASPAGRSTSTPSNDPGHTIAASAAVGLANDDDSGPSAAVIGAIAAAVLIAIIVGVVLVVRSGGAGGRRGAHSASRARSSG